MIMSLWSYSKIKEGHSHCQLEVSEKLTVLKPTKYMKALLQIVVLKPA